MKTFITTLLITFSSIVTTAQTAPLPASPIIISQYIETSSGSTPKGIELWNVSGVSIDFSIYPLTVLKGANGNTPSADITVNTGVIAPEELLVIGTSDIGTYLTNNGLVSVLYQLKAFTFNGDDALIIMIDGDTSDVFGEPGIDPGTSWSANGVSTKNQNISLVSGVVTGDFNGWSDPSIRFTNTAVGTDLTDFGIAPIVVPCTNTGIDIQTACDTYTWVDGNTYTTSNNTATHILTNIAGCDSTVTLDLTINTSNTGTDVQIVCDTYTWIDGNTYTSNNSTATYTLINMFGCDSIVTLDLTINTSTFYTDTQTTCDAYTWMNGVTYTANNTIATFTTTNFIGCLYVATLNLTVNNSTSSTDVQAACDTYTWIDGNTYTSNNTTAMHTLINSVGCDSIITLDLTITESVIAIITQIGADLSVTLGDTYLWSTTETTQLITPNANETYWCIVTVNGCVSDTAFFDVNYVGINDAAIVNDLMIYPNPFDNVFNVTFNSKDIQSVDVRVLNILGEVIFIESKTDFIGEYNHQFNLKDYSKGLYFLEIKTQNGRSTNKLILQ